MSQEKRKFTRRKVNFDVEITVPSGKIQITRTRDISDGGVFVFLEKSGRPVIGEVVTVKMAADAKQLGESFPSDDAVVVRQEEDGIGLAFIELDFNSDV